MSTLHIEHITKSFPIHHGRAQRKVLDDITLTVQPAQRWGIMGPNGAGKSTLIQIISGSLKPDAGTVHRGMTVSWPLAFGGAFQGSLTGRDNARLIARVYGADVQETVERVEAFAELGIYLDEPVKTYSSGMNSRLSFALSMAIDFDCFLVDEVISVGDVRFNRKCEEELRSRADKAMLLVSHHTDLIRNNCDHAAFLRDGKLHFFDSVEEAIAVYEGM
ncbi:MAG: ABC transporter ATP-binding protein [Acidithiobacillus sp.]|uniref:ABC transporter ATP-binding protein n=1 Tax=Acidithiobacillus sp. TaxID=1872118 RepID=UPI003CFCE6E9